MLMLFGLAMVYPTMPFVGGESLLDVKRQAISALIGLCVMLLLFRLDYHRLLCLGWYQLYTLSTVLLVATLVSERNSCGRVRWIRLDPMSFQPSEFMKTALMLFFAVYLVNYYYSFSETPKHVSWMTAVFDGIPVGLIVLQNLSTGLLLSTTVFLVTLLGVKNNRVHPRLMTAKVAPSFFATHYYKKLPFLHPYQITRTESWLNPDAGANGSDFQMRLGKHATNTGG